LKLYVSSFVEHIYDENNIKFHLFTSIKQNFTKKAFKNFK